MAEQVKVTDFEIGIRKLKFDDVFNIVEDLPEFDNLADQYAKDGWRKLFVSKRVILSDVAKKVLDFPEGKGFGDLYPSDLVDVIIPKFLEVNQDFFVLASQIQGSQADQVSSPSET